MLRRRKVAKHFTLDIGDDHFSYARDPGSIAAETALDGVYVLRTSVTSGGEAVSSYKALAHVERGLPRLQHRPRHPPHPPPHEEQVRAQVFLRMLSYYITWHMQARLAPMLFTNNDRLGDADPGCHVGNLPGYGGLSQRCSADA